MPLGPFIDYAFTPIRFVREVLDFEPDEPQARVLASCARRGILNCTRQWGKSTITAAKAVHRAATRGGSLIVVIGPSGRQSGEFIEKARRFVACTGIAVRGDGINRDSILLPNGSRLIGLPENERNTRGFSATSLLLVDEAARVESAAFEAMVPVLATSGGDMWLMSTPDGRSGFFYEIWARGDDNWLRISVPATECPRIPAEFLEEERGRKSEAVFRQEYLCEFADASGR
jgi:hypothetical protein